MNCCHCEYWGLTQEDIDYGFDLGQLPTGKDHQPCRHPHVGKGSYNDESRLASDSLNSFESIFTGPFFGCKHYKDKRK